MSRWIRYREALPKIVVGLFGLTLYLCGVYERSKPFSICGMDGFSSEDLITFRIGQIFCSTLLAANICFALYLREETKPSLFPLLLATITNGFIAVAYTKEILPSPETIILWIPRFIVGEMFEATSQIGKYDSLYRQLSFLSITSLLISGYQLVNWKWIIPSLRRLVAAKTSH